MPFYKYTVANIEGKKLSGTVEAPNEQTARAELNNLGFSILQLSESTPEEVKKSDTPKFVFEAIDKNSQQITGTTPGKDKVEVLKKLEEEYDLTITALWPEGSDAETIKQARLEGQKHLQDRLLQAQQQEEKEVKNLEQQKEEQFVKNKIEKILNEVYALLKNFDEDFALDQKAMINKKIDKLLRIKHSTNLEYILATAEELLQSIQEQEKVLNEKGLKDKRLELTIKTQNLLKELNRSSKPKSLAEDVLSRIQRWEEKHQEGNVKQNFFHRYLYKILKTVKEIFETPPEVAVIREQVKIYNKQLWDFAKLYFKESTPEYRQKIKTALKTIWKARSKAKHTLTQVKKGLKKRRLQAKYQEKSLAINILEEINLFSGWLLAFYLLFYFVGLYITTKDFGFATIPDAFYIYDSRIMKYILALLFITHASSSIKINFFRTNKLANIVIFPIFIISSIVAILNF